jgi:hypothetical protein
VEGAVLGLCRRARPPPRAVAALAIPGSANPVTGQEPAQSGWPEPSLISFFHMSSTSLTTFSGIGT